MRAVPRWLVILMLGLAVPSALDAQAAGEERPDRDGTWAFFFNLGGGGLHGDFSSAMRAPMSGEFGLRQTRGNWRFGLGASFTSFLLVEPYDEGAGSEVGYQRTFLSAGRLFPNDGPFRPYIEARLGAARIHPRSVRFERDPLPVDFEVGDSPTPAWDGISLGIMPGAELSLSNSVALDFSLLGDFFSVEEADLSPVGQGTASTGFDWQARLGVVWETDANVLGGPRPPNEWGVRPSWGWSLGEVFAINLGASAFNEYVRNANFNQISPRSWWYNIEHPFTYDDNEFTTNQFIHPFNGSQYYNAARSHGLSFWPSYGLAFLGAWQWEVMGETHPPSLNDQIATGIGGAAVGEAMYRFSSMILDTEATGGRRILREASAFLVDPIRGFNRLVSGRAWEVRPNPADRMDTNPLGQINASSFGWRRVANRSSLTNDVSDRAFIEYTHEHGNVFDNPRRDPFDFFTFEGMLNFGAGDNVIGSAYLEGNLVTAPIGESRPANHAFALVQHYAYDNNASFEFGGQSLGASIFSRWGKEGRWRFDTRFDIMATLMGAVLSEGAQFADVPDQEREREYDYGPGAGGAARLSLKRDGSPFFSVKYRFHYVHTTNGSIFQQDEGIGLTSHHWLHGADFRLDLPLSPDWAIGARYITFARESHFSITAPEELPDNVAVSVLVKQTRPEARLYLSYRPSLGG